MGWPLFLPDHGYLNTCITKDAMTADFRVLDHVTTPGSPVRTKASFAIRGRVPGLQANG